MWELIKDFAGFMGDNENPLLPSIDVRFNADWANNDSLSMIQEYIMGHDGVKEVYYQKSLVHLINRNLRRISIILLAISILLFIITVALINNTIRLSVYSKRFTIRSMQLVGATRGFIRKPFLFTSAASGFTGSLVALAILFGLVYLLQEEFEGVISLKDYDMLSILALGVILTGIVLNVISTFFAVNKYLNIKTDKLY